MTNQNELVLVTGATGFVGKHCILALLEKGYRVRGTVRALSSEPALRESLSRHTAKIEALELVAANLMEDQGWEEAADGCQYVLHVASPLPINPPKNEDDLIIPACEGARHVLQAAAKNHVKRVVMTSSVAAIAYGHPEKVRTFNEEDWSDPQGEGRINAYQKSKTLAEKTAWDFVSSLDENHNLELTTINPGYILGPVLDARERTANEMHKVLMRREVPGVARIKFNLVDVRDVAQAHVLAMTIPEAAGNRFICVAEDLWIKEVATILETRFKDDGYKIPTRLLPTFLLRLAAIFDKTVRNNLDSIDLDYSFDTGKIKNILGWQPRPIEDTIIEMGESLIREGLV